MRVLLLGGGGREHALGWKLVSSPLISELISCPGNPGLAQLGRIEPLVNPTDPRAVVALTRDNAVDLVVIGPEGPLASGVADALRAAHVPVFGPGREGAELEASKSFAKEIMADAGVPTAGASTFGTADDAKEYLRAIPGPYVVKANGLAAGKGVLVTESITDAEAWVDECLHGRFGYTGATVVIEEFMDGDEVSVFFLCHDGVAIPFEPARDYKLLRDADEGPNTGGMGSFSPVDDLPDGLTDWTTDHVAVPTLKALARRGIPYTGFLYVGLMLTDTGPRVVEYNCRLGDPETQALMPRLDSDLVAVLTRGLSEGFGDISLEWSDIATVNVVLAADGYPERPQTGDPITGLDDLGNAIVFHAGTRRDGDRLLTSGGRVVNIVGTGATIAEARSCAYDAVGHVTFSGIQYRTDIATQKG